MVESTALEMRHRGNSIVGSNPTLSAILAKAAKFEEHPNHPIRLMSAERAAFPPTARRHVRQKATPVKCCETSHRRAAAVASSACGGIFASAGYPRPSLNPSGP